MCIVLPKEFIVMLHNTLIFSFLFPYGVSAANNLYCLIIETDLNEQDGPYGFMCHRVSWLDKQGCVRKSQSKLCCHNVASEEALA